MSFIPSDIIRSALAGTDPALGHPIDQAELGRRLAPHRRGRYPNTPYRQAAISLYMRKPETQSADFVNAFRSWALAEAQRQPHLRLLPDGANADELLAESDGRLVQLGAGAPRALLVLGELPEGVLVDAAADVPRLVVCRAQIGRCACGTLFVRRSQLHIWCSPDCTARQRRRTA